ncbi:hypothetical protein [Bifidobacterium gallicum]|uniref:Heterocyst differentiation related protein n=1 Tax=Bifidobacterium gallicum DSM 20093 = LMG 11596 TaxID=561180 RepID=D1NST6_9BIFI|nr:hypothetical protein [Bifidobacterium gallicum]EFA23738.1 hypothetical protein BIFGAL_02846 [Bifidobacterium gallicum DSM 20093 = LMG 11596]KFI59243.1 heterocyst differentiation related protein [Bifidobacterium gallicum DSM 20093 = LMG 11596]
MNQPNQHGLHGDVHTGTIEANTAEANTVGMNTAETGAAEAGQPYAVAPISIVPPTYPTYAAPGMPYAGPVPMIRPVPRRGMLRGADGRVSLWRVDLLLAIIAVIDALLGVAMDLTVKTDPAFPLMFFPYMLMMACYALLVPLGGAIVIVTIVAAICTTRSYEQPLHPGQSPAPRVQPYEQTPYIPAARTQVRPAEDPQHHDVVP